MGRRVLACLAGVEAEQAPDEPYILVMDEVAPSDVATLSASPAFSPPAAAPPTAPSSRGRWVFRPSSAPGPVCSAGAQHLLLLDGERGELLVAPSDTQLDEAGASAPRGRNASAWPMSDVWSRRSPVTAIRWRSLPTSAPPATPEAVALGAEGIGLLRTELVFMNHAQAPDQATQEAEYRRVLEGRPLVVRTLDVGGDKPLPYWPMPAEENPFLGVRGIRLSLQRPDILETQLRALLASADGRPLRIMFPMVGNIEEWRTAKALVDACASNCRWPTCRWAS